MTARIIYVDLNSYFASVEQAEDPTLMGKPVAVVPVMAETTSCLAASYPAKARGIKTGTKVHEARRLRPEIIFVQADHRKYVDYHHRIIEAVERCLPVWKVYSIDEMAIKLFGREQTESFAHKTALNIKERIKSDIHPALTCSIGIAPNRYLAKIASDMQKPDGLVVLRKEELPDRLHSLSIRDFPGIGPRMEERLSAARCLSAKNLCERSEAELRAIWGGKVGSDFWRLIRGEDVQERAHDRGTISHSRVLSPEKRTPSHAWACLVSLVSKAAVRLRQERFYARSLHLHLQHLHPGIGTHHWQSRAKFFETQDTAFLLDELTRLWSKAQHDNILKVAVVLGGLVPSNKHQLSLTEDLKQLRLMSAVDRLNGTHRKNLVVVGASSEFHGAVRDPIAFGYIPK